LPSCPSVYLSVPNSYNYFTEMITILRRNIWVTHYLEGHSMTVQQIQLTFFVTKYPFMEHIPFDGFLLIVKSTFCSTSTVIYHLNNFLCLHKKSATKSIQFQPRYLTFPFIAISDLYSFPLACFPVY